jgi:hypothetical protein
LTQEQKREIFEQFKHEIVQEFYLEKSKLVAYKEPEFSNSDLKEFIWDTLGDLIEDLKHDFYASKIKKDDVDPEEVEKIKLKYWEV